MEKKALRIVFIFFLFSTVAEAQDDLMKTALENTETPKTSVIATFKTTKLINAQTNETVHKRTLDFRVGHRFGNVGKESNGGVHSLYGLDASTDIRISFEYGFTDRLTIGFSRSKRQENLEGLIKYRVLEQTTDNKIPLAVTVFANTAYTPVSYPEGYFSKTTDRFTYTMQLILARKFSDRISFAVLPTFIHRNFIVDLNDNNNLFALGGGGRFKITRSTSIIVDYFYNFNELRKINNDYGFFNPLGAGIEIETGGHVFTIMFTNAAGIIENDFIPNTTDSWSKGGFKFSFNISRNFRL